LKKRVNKLKNEVASKEVVKSVMKKRLMQFENRKHH